MTFTTEEWDYICSFKENPEQAKIELQTATRNDILVDRFKGVEPLSKHDISWLKSEVKHKVNQFTHVLKIKLRDLSGEIG